ncbi:MAG: DUF1295 domain-containing protein [Bacillota bacterium]
MKKIQHLLIILVIYFIALVIAYRVYHAVTIESVMLTILIADLVATGFIFLMSTVFKNASIYDPYWSVAPLVMVIPFIETLNTPTLLVLSALYFWGIRLTLNWIYTFKDLHQQDWRYDYYKHKSKRLWPIVNLFGIHMMPTIVVFLVMIPVFTLLTHPQPTNVVTVFGWVVMVGAVMIQAFADKQMHDHLKQRPNAVNKTGLWRMSRHPNYFGEITFWFGAYMMALSVSTNYLIGIGAFINLLMFMTISIPLMEKRQLTRRPEYESYIETTHVLIPIPKDIEDHKQNA